MTSGTVDGDVRNSREKSRPDRTVVGRLFLQPESEQIGERETRGRPGKMQGQEEWQRTAETMVTRRNVRQSCSWSKGWVCGSDQQVKVFSVGKD